MYVLKSPEIIDRCIAEIKTSLGKTVTIKDSKRNNDQNALYWKLVSIIAKEIGETQDDLHAIIKVRFLGVQKRFVDGVELVEPISTTTLTTKEFAGLIDKVYALAANLNIIIPQPDYWGLECTG